MERTHVATTPVAMADALKTQRWPEVTTVNAIHIPGWMLMEIVQPVSLVFFQGLILHLLFNIPSLLFSLL